MTNLNQDLQDKLRRLNIFEKLIVVNLVVFLIAILLKNVLNLNLSWVELPSSFQDFILKPWSIITYAFVHYDFWHFFFNMVMLYFVGKMFSNMFSVKMGLNVYFLGAISGGLLFLLAYNIFPNVFIETRLIGASGAIFALLIFLCAYMPTMEVRIFTFNIKLWYIGAFFVGVVLLNILAGIQDPIQKNAGGNLAHLGGALLGYMYAKQLMKGKDIGKGFEGLMDSIAGMFKKGKIAPLKTVYKNKSGKVAGYTKAEFSEFNNQKKVDLILDKISKSGYDSLTADEKEFLFKAGK